MNSMKQNDVCYMFITRWLRDVSFLFVSQPLQSEQ
jgi:hypothetical protein